MSIIDDISTFEEQLKLVRKDGEQKISVLREETDAKKKQMKDYFVQELTEQGRVLEQEMSQRVEEYKQELAHSQVDIKDLLEQQYRIKRQEIIQQICRQFWGE
ncbi:MAG: hypothetical protein ACRC0X_00920 [Brevinema sp.]